MRIEELLARCQGLAVYEDRGASADYGERVFYARDLADWDRVLSEGMGPAVKPAGTAPSKVDRRLADPFGGIRANQTLYKTEGPEGTVIAMFWPWESGEQITLKVARVAA